MEIRKLFSKISSTAGTAEKSALMNDNINDTIKQIYEDTYNKDRNYGVKKFEMPTKGGWDTIDKNYKKFHNMLEKLNSREVTGNDAIALVEKTIGSFCIGDQEILKAILQRKLTIGLSKASFDKLIGEEATKEFTVTLAYLLDKVKGVNPIDGTFFASRKCDGCVDGDTLVEFENGEKYPIKDIVDHKIQGKVKSFDEFTGKIVYRDIIDWMHNIKDIDNTQKDWFEIQLENGKVLKITANDKVYVKNKGWTRVDQLTENDEILTE